MPVVEQQVQAAEPMTTQTNNVEVDQPKVAPTMSTSGDQVGLRGGEEAGCNLCCCGCEEQCC